MYEKSTITEEAGTGHQRGRRLTVVAAAAVAVVLAAGIRTPGTRPPVEAVAAATAAPTPPSRADSWWPRAGSLAVLPPTPGSEGPLITWHAPKPQTPPPHPATDTECFTLGAYSGALDPTTHVLAGTVTNVVVHFRHIQELSLKGMADLTNAVDSTLANNHMTTDQARRLPDDTRVCVSLADFALVP